MIDFPVLLDVETPPAVRAAPARRGQAGLRPGGGGALLPRQADVRAGGGGGRGVAGDRVGGVPLPGGGRDTAHGLGDIAELYWYFLLVEYDFRF